MSRDNASLLDIYEAGQQILSFAQGLTQAELREDSMRISAILYQIMIVGEATKRLSHECRTKHPDIPWSRMAGMRDSVTHHYDRIDFQVLWNVIQYSIPEVLDAIELILPE